MDALVLSALGVDPVHGSAVSAVLLEALAARSFKVQVVDVVAADVHGCRGCGSCGLKTPGRCVIDDDMQEIYPRIVSSDLMVYATPVSFGAHRSELKRVLDRFQPLMVPFYLLRDGEMNFRPRYPRRPALLGVGVLSAPDADQEEAYRLLIARHASNMAAPARATAVLTAVNPAEALRASVDTALDSLGLCGSTA